MVFEPSLLPQAEKERLVRELLDEFGLRIHSHAAYRHELVIPCVLGEHRNQDREPTGAVNYQKLTFKCLGCQRSGGLLWFIASHRGTTSIEARKWLGKETGTDGQVQELPALLRYFDALYGTKAERAPIPKYSDRVLDPWRLIHPWVTDPPEYDEKGRNIGGRGVPEENVERFQIGYAENYAMGFREDEQGNRIALSPSERIILPHFWNGSLVGWQTRRLAADGTPKYKSSVDFPKDQTLYNYDLTAESTVVVESPFSVARHDHVVHMEATFGANVTEVQIKALVRHPRLVFWMDNDPAGWSANLGLFDNRRRQTKVGLLEECAKFTDVWVVESDYDADPADMSEEDVVEHVRKAIPWVVWGIPKALRCYRCKRTAHEGGC